MVHSSASALSTAGVLLGHGPSSKISTTSLSARKSSCLKCSKPKPGPPVVSISTTRLTPSASALAHAAFGCKRAAGRAGEGKAAEGLTVEDATVEGATVEGLAAIVAVTSISSAGARVDLAEAAAGSRSACRALTVSGAARTARGEYVQNHTATITKTRTETTLANITPNALRIFCLSGNPDVVRPQRH